MKQGSLSCSCFASRPSSPTAPWWSSTHDNRVFQFGDRIAHMDDGVVDKIEERAVEAAA